MRPWAVIEQKQILKRELHWALIPMNTVLFRFENIGATEVCLKNGSDKL